MLLNLELNIIPQKTWPDKFSPEESLQGSQFVYSSCFIFSMFLAGHQTVKKAILIWYLGLRSRVFEPRLASCYY